MAEAKVKTTRLKMDQLSSITAGAKTPNQQLGVAEGDVNHAEVTEIASLGQPRWTQDDPSTSRGDEPSTARPAATQNLTAKNAAK
ncbi:hypothetical protein LTR85_007438 [Meristemomyces frigidus]|nr:hypothetical protein LTR85_007438 [Meristemomyces frigidus]